MTDWLIGDSLLRNVDLDNLSRNTKVECLRGASISERQEIADQVNVALSVLCEETGVTFVSHDNNFRLADNSVEDLVLADDGIQLNAAGTTRLPKNRGFHNLNNSSKKKSKQNHSTNKRQTKTRKQAGSKDKHHPVIRRSAQFNYAQVPLSSNKRQHSRENRDSCCWYCGETGHTADSCRHGYRIT